MHPLHGISSLLLLLGSESIAAIPSCPRSSFPSFPASTCPPCYGKPCFFLFRVFQEGVTVLKQMLEMEAWQRVPVPLKVTKASLALVFLFTPLVLCCMCTPLVVCCMTSVSNRSSNNRCRRAILFRPIDCDSDEISANRAYVAYCVLSPFWQAGPPIG